MSDLNTAFDQLVSDYYRAWFHHHPEAAVDAGVSGYADRLTPYGDDDRGALLALNEMLLSALEEIEVTELEPARQIDYRVLQGAAWIELYELTEIDWRRRDPARFLPVNAIYQLTVRPVADLGAALLGRVEAVPAHLRGARRHLLQEPERIPPLWLESAIEEARQGAGFLRGLVHDPRVGRAFSTPGRLAQPLEDAARALESFAGFLESELGPRASGSPAAGRELFERVLRYRHFLDVDCEALHRLGDTLCEQTLGQLRALVRDLRGDEDIGAMHDALARDCPPPDSVLGTYREAMQAAREFVIAHDLVSVPERQRLQVVETPAFMRHQVPFAAYLEPAPTDVDQHGYYYVTVARQVEHGHSRAGIDNTCVHEAWPGHHLQFVTANSRPDGRRLARLLNPSATLYEGWALYCEQLMSEQGFLTTPEQRFVLLSDRLWRALRIQLDVDLHLERLSPAAAGARMAEVLGFDPGQARAEVSWYTRAPGTPLGYAVGWSLIEAARSVLQEREPAFDLKGFHDRLLAQGSIGLPLVLEGAFDADVRHRAQQAVFGQVRAPSGAKHC